MINARRTARGDVITLWFRRLSVTDLSRYVAQVAGLMNRAAAGRFGPPLL